MSKGSSRTVVVTGGGSGGHITPILAVAGELKRLDPKITIVYISQKGDAMDDVVAADPNIDELQAVAAGKFRRYHGEGLGQFLDIKTMYLNLRDALRVLGGIWQSYKLLRQLQPGIIFTRGSYVSVPVCLAASLLKIPYVTHDSDVLPSLTNRIIAKKASLHAVALPEELYPYAIDKTVTVGVPISPAYRHVDDALRKRYKQQLNLDGYEWILLVAGGGLGSQIVNRGVLANARELLTRYPGLAIVHQAGRANQDEVDAEYRKLLPPDMYGRVRVLGFTQDMFAYSGAANIVIARAGATNLAELAVQGKACILVPSPFLTGGHQLKNAAALRDKGAVLELTEEQLEQELRLTSVVSDLLDNPRKLQELGANFVALARPDAAARIATLLLERYEAAADANDPDADTSERSKGAR